MSQQLRPCVENNNHQNFEKNAPLNAPLPLHLLLNGAIFPKFFYSINDYVYKAGLNWGNFHTLKPDIGWGDLLELLAGLTLNHEHKRWFIIIIISSLKKFLKQKQEKAEQ